MMIDVDATKRELVRISHLFYHRQWSLATSSNYSARINPDRILITASGKDKGTLTDADILLLDLEGGVIDDSKETPSAETKLHCELYKFHPEIGAILHTHSAFATVLSSLPNLKAPLSIGGYEMLKAFEGVSSHLHTEQIPIFSNDQDMNRLSSVVLQHMENNSRIHGFLISGHGLYSFGKDLTSAVRHIEAFEFLFECEYRKLLLK
jgi:methylthioribulose-1-phosphate dehydratase